MSYQMYQPTSGSVARSGGPGGLAALFGASALLVLLAAVLPISSNYDATYLDAGFITVVLFFVPAAMLAIAAFGAAKPELRALGVGAAFFAGSFQLAIALVLWVYSEGEGLGAGSWMMTLAPIAAAVAIAMAVPSIGTSSGPPVLRFALIGGVVMAAGTMLVPSDASDRGIDFATWNGFGEYQKEILGVAMLIANWMPVVALAIALKKGGRVGAMLGLGGALPLAVANVSAQLELFDRDNSLQTFRTLVHPVALIGSLAVVVLVIVGLTATRQGGSVPVTAAVGGGNPARWAPDPLARHQMRYWDGRQWTEHVSDAGVMSLDDGTGPTSVAPTQVLPVTPAVPAAPPYTPLPPVAPPAPSFAPAPPPTSFTPPAPLAPSPSFAPAPPPAPSLDATVDRTVLRGMRTDVPPFTIVLDDGTTSEHRGVLLIGRDPSARPTDINPSYLAISDSTMSVSKSHLAIGRDDNGFWVQDRGSMNGSAVTMSDGRTIGIAAEQVQRVPTGARIMIGDRWLEIR